MVVVVVYVVVADTTFIVVVSFGSGIISNQGVYCCCRNITVNIGFTGITGNIFDYGSGTVVSFTSSIIISIYVLIGGCGGG